VRELGLLLAFIASQVSAEPIFHVDGHEVVLNPSDATKKYIESTASDFRLACEGYFKIEAALQDLALTSDFPLSIKEYPATDIASGLFMLEWVGQSIGYKPSSFPLMWNNLHGNKEGVLGRVQRDDILALWTVTASRTPLNCEEGL